jgi:hypothetical protein
MKDVCGSSSAVEAFSALLHEFDLETDADARDLPPDRRAQFEARLKARESGRSRRSGTWSITSITPSGWSA